MGRALRDIARAAESLISKCGLIAVLACGCAAAQTPLEQMAFRGFSFAAPLDGWRWSTNAPPYLAHGQKRGEGFDAQIQVMKLSQTGEHYARTGEWQGWMTSGKHAGVELEFASDHNAPCKRYKHRWNQRLTDVPSAQVLTAVLDEQGLECINPAEPSRMVLFRYFVRSPTGLANARMQAEAKAFFGSIVFTPLDAVPSGDSR